MSNFSREITVFSTSQREVDLHSSSEFFPSTYDVSSGRVGNVQQYSLAVDGSQSIISFQRTDSDDRDSSTPPDRNIYLSNIGSSSETQINNNNFSPITPYIGQLSDGRYLNLWQSYNQDGSQSGIFGKVTDFSGREIISEFQVNENSFGDQYQFDVAVEINGDFVVAWSSYVGTDGPLQSHLRFFDVNATPASSEILITNEPNPSGIGVQQFQNPEVSFLSTGDVVVVSRGISQLDVKLVDPVSYEVSPIGKVDGGTQHDVAALEDGRFVIVWEEDERYSLAPGGETSQINGAILNSTGSIESPLSVNNDAQYDHFAPNVLSLPDGGFMVGWVKQGLVEIQRFNSEGLALGEFSDLQINEIDDYGYATWAELDSVSSNTVRVSFLSGTSNGFGKHVKSTDVDVGFVGTTGNDFVSEVEYFSFFALGVGDDTFVGQVQAALVFGDGGDDLFISGFGDDTLNGGAGVDTALYSGNQNSYSLTLSSIGTTIEDRRAEGNGTDTLSSIEFLYFDTDLTGAPFDLQEFGGAAGLVAEGFENFIEFYIAYFNRAPDALGLNFWGTAFANGTTLEEMATLFVDQDETRATYPEGTSDTDFVTAVYDNVLGRIPDQGGFNFWVDMLNRSEETGVTRDQFILEVLRGVQDGSADRAYLDTKVDIGAYFAVHRGMSDTGNASAAMELFDGTQGSVNDAVAAIDGYYQEALDPINGEFLMQVVGVLDNPFA